VGSQPAAAPPLRPHLEWLSDGVVVVLPVLASAIAILGGHIDGPRWVLLGFALGQSLALAWYRRYPLAALTVVVGIEVVLVMLGIEILVGSLAAVFGLGAWGGRLQQRTGLALLLALLAFGTTVSVAGGERPGSVLPGMVALAAMVVGFWAVGRLGAWQRRRLGELNAYSRRLEHERELAVERERALLARELHDILNHSVTAIVLDAEAVAETGTPEEARTALRRTAASGRQSLAELRRLLGVLRNVPGHDPLVVPAGLDQIETLVQSMPEGGPTVRLQQRGPARPMDASVAQAAYRVVQESLTNVVKHAGPVSAAVSLSYGPATLTVRVTNTAGTQPAGAAVPGNGLGLVGMRERVELVGGSLRAGPSPDGGFAVEAVLPTGDDS
jgi:signal transduction histidine kinase